MRWIIAKLSKNFKICNRSIAFLKVLCNTKRCTCTSTGRRYVDWCLISFFGKAGIMIFNQRHLIDYWKLIGFFVTFIKFCLLYRMPLDVQQSLFYPCNIFIMQNILYFFILTKNDPPRSISDFQKSFLSCSGVFCTIILTSLQFDSN